jgi:hypothetical protein
MSFAGLQSDGAELLSIEADKAANRCTAGSLAAREGVRAAILSALADGCLGTRRIADAFSVSREVVRALRAQCIKSGELDQVKKVMAGEFFALADAARERLMDEIDKVPLATLYAAMGTAFDKGQILSGGVTQRVERRDGASVGEVADYISSMLNVTPIQPVGAGESSALKALGAPSAGADWVGSMGGKEVSVDIESIVSAHSLEVAPAQWAESGQFAPISPTDSPSLAPLASPPAVARTQGAGGVSVSQGGADSSTR